MNVLVCVKRVPAAAGKMTLTADEQDIDTRFLGFTISPHEECAVEEAVRLIEAHGGSSAVLTVGPEAAVAQLQDAMALGIDRGILVPIEESEWDPEATARAIVEAVQRQRSAGSEFDLLMFGNEAADSGDYQVAVRVAHALDLPCATGIKGIELPLPAVVSVKEGINLPRYPSIPGRLKARRKPIDRVELTRRSGGLQKVRLIVPEGRGRQVEILGRGPEAAPRVVEVLREIGVLT